MKLKNVKRYRVEFRISNKNYFRKDCFEDELNIVIELMESIRKVREKGRCFYRQFPLGKNKTMYF